MMTIKSMLTVLLIGLTSFSGFVSASAEKDSEHAAIAKVTYTYFDGLYLGNNKLMNKAFDMENGQVKSLENGKIQAISLKAFSNYFTEKSDETWQGKILSMDVVDNRMAFVKFDFDTPDSHYIDYLILLKTDGEWKITNKAYVENKK